jgi:NAD(P)-dependent dehydrogenase (short-subunit alcohol dehydrogenase family)
MMDRLTGKVAIVTGAGSGIGRAIAELFAAEGARVVCADVSGREVETAQAIGEAAVALRCDVSQAAEVGQMIAAAETRFGRLDILCNNAGLGGVNQLLVDTSEDYFDRMVAVNLKGVFLGMKHAIPVMARTGGGSIINTASAAGIVGWKGIAVYSATKGGVVQMTKSVALECADQGVRVNAVCPGMTWTGATGAGAGRETPSSGLPREMVPMGRWAMPAEIATAYLYLASDEASYVTGLIMAVDGGYVAG